MGEIERLTLRVPAELVEELRRLAEQHHRSLNGELVHALSGYALALRSEQPRETLRR